MLCSSIKEDAFVDVDDTDIVCDAPPGDARSYFSYVVSRRLPPAPNELYIAAIRACSRILLLVSVYVHTRCVVDVEDKLIYLWVLLAYLSDVVCTPCAARPLSCI